MPTPGDVIGSLYLGESGCRSIEIDLASEAVTLRLIDIVQMQDRDKGFQLGVDENIASAALRLSGVHSFTLESGGYLPNDSFVEWGAKPEVGERWLVTFTVYCVRDGAGRKAVIRIVCRDAELVLDACGPGEARDHR